MEFQRVAASFPSNPKREAADYEKMRQSVNSGRSFTSSALSQEAEPPGIQIRHGVVAGERLLSGNVLRQVLFHRPRNTLVALDGKGIQMWNARRISNRVPVSVNLTGIVYASKSNQYVGYRGTKLKLFDERFHITFETNFCSEFFCAVYNDLTNEVVTCGQGKITCWMFRRGSKIIVPRVEITDGLALNESLSCLHLEKIASRSQRCFVVSGSDVHVHNLHEAKHLKTYCDLHPRPITSFLHWPALGLVFTGAKDGSVKVWNEEFVLQQVLVGHKKTVSSLAMYPYGAFLLTGSQDATIRLWGLDTGNEVDRLEARHPVNGLVTHLRHDQFYSYSSNCIDTWTINRVHTFLAKLGSPVRRLFNTTHPRVPLRLLALCENGAIHVLSPVSGDVISTALLPVSQEGRDLAYAPEADELFGLCKNGKIFAFDTKTHPAKRVNVLATDVEIGLLMCLFMYEYTMDEEMLQDAIARDQWFGVIMSVEGRHAYSKKDRTLLLGGTALGFLVWLNQKTGKTQCLIKAHESEISSMAANPKKDWVVTVGIDKILKVWRLYPFASEPFSPLLSFYCSQASSHMAIAGETLLAVFQNPLKASYSTTAFRIIKKSRALHDADDDHNDAILGLACCEKIRIFATCSEDRTVRVWSDESQLLREIQFNSVPEAVAFSSARGNLAISMGGQIYIVDFRKFLPKSYLERMISMRFPGVTAEYTRETSSEQWLDEADRVRLVSVQTTPSVGRYTPVSEAPSQLESDEYKQEMKAKEQMMALLSERNEEINRIRDGVYAREKEKLKVQLSDQLREKAWRKYYDDVAPDFVSVKFDPNEEFDPDTYGRDIPDKTETEEPYRRPFPDKFFPPLSKHDPPYSVASDGHIPNSIVLKEFLKGQDIEEVRSRWTPRTLNDDQLALLARKQAGQSDDEDEDIFQDDAPKESDFMERLKAALDESPEPEEPTPSPTPPTSPPPPRPRLPPPTQKKIVKFVAPKPKTPSPPPPPPKDPTPPPREPTPPRTPTPPPPPTPIPDFISQFIGESWFDQLFPETSSVNFPKPWTIGHFIDLLLRGLRQSSEMGVKTAIVKALHLLYQQEGFPNKSAVIQTLRSQLNGDQSPNSVLEDDKRFILENLRLLFGLDVADTAFVVELMAQYVDGDEEMREVVTTYFLTMGLDDPNQYFLPRELDSWETWNLDEDDRKAGIIAMASDWLQRWTVQCERYLASQRKGDLKTLRSGVSKVSPGRKGKGREPVKFADEIETFTKPVDVINYFVGIEHAKEMERLRALRSQTETETITEELKRNTVLTLPRIPKTSLARLGETHCSKCHPERETSLAITHLPVLDLHSRNLRLPSSVLHQFSRCVSLALRPNVVAPFTEEKEDDNDASQSLSLYPKYFVLERSYVGDRKF